MFKEKIQNLLNRMGYQIKKTESFDPSMEDEFRGLYRECKGMHLQSMERLYALFQSVHHLIATKIQGDIVECGVFKGASAVLAAAILKKAGCLDRKLYLYDTYEGWPEPAAHDRFFSADAVRQKTVWGQKEIPGLQTVQKTVWSTGYPKENFIFVKGRVEDTLPSTRPEKIGLLRLDTDGYESTKHELIHLYPKLVPGGILLIDDYGHWQGSKKAVDEYFAEHNIAMMLNRIDYTGRVGIKMEKHPS